MLSLADAAFVGRLGAESLAGLGAAGAVAALFHAAEFALQTGCTVVCAEAEGEAEAARDASRPAEEARVAAARAHLLVGAAVAAALLLIGPVVLARFGLSQGARAEAVRYLAVFALVPLAAVFIGTYRAVLLGAGRTAAAAAVGATAALVRFAALPLAVARFGAAGAAGAMLVGTLAAGLAGRILAGPFALGLPGAAAPGAGGRFRRALRVGAPSFAELLLYVLGQALVLRVAAAAGEAVLASFVVLRRTMNLHPAVQQAIGTVATVRVGRSLGAGARDASRREVARAARVSLGVAAGAGLFAAAFARPLAALAGGPAVSGKVAAVLPLAILVFLPQAANIVFGGALRGAGETAFMARTQAAGAVLAPAGAFVFTGPLGAGLLGLLLATALDETVRAVWNARRAAGIGQA